MNTRDQVSLSKGINLISPELGLLNYISRLPIMYGDPKLISFGIWPCDTTCLGGLKFGGRSSGCGYQWEKAVLATLGEVVERYCPAFYSEKGLVKSTYRDLDRSAVHPDEVALFHQRQYESEGFPFVPFTEDHPLHWTPCYDLIDGGEKLYPGSLVFMPWSAREKWIGLSTSTGLAGHTNIHEAILVGLYELIERDSFVITWMNDLVTPKIVIDDDIRQFIAENYPPQYDFHLFDISFDLQTPTVFGIMFGEAEFGPFISVGSATRGTYADAARKTIMEIGQATAYFRYILESKADWCPEDYNDIHDFEDHSVFYIKRRDLWHIFDKWKNAVPSKKIDFNEVRPTTTQQEIRRILGVMSDKGYDVLLKDLTTVDVEQAGFRSVKVMIPQLIQMAGSYKTYFNGGRRLFEVPEQMGYGKRTYDDLNPYPHPFP